MVSGARTILMVLITARLLMPPGICACKWSSPAARLLVALVQSERIVPNTNDADNEDDDAPGCPASPLAVGMGVKPPCEPVQPPDLSFDVPPPTQQALSFSSISAQTVALLRIEAPAHPLYVTLRALLV